MNNLSNYYRQVELALDCPRALRKSFLCDARRMADDYRSARPEATEKEIMQFLGEPQALAGAFQDILPQAMLERHRKRRKTVKRLMIGLTAVLLFSSIAFSVFVASVKSTAVVTKESTITIYETQEEEA